MDADGRARRKNPPVAGEQALRPRLRPPFVGKAYIFSCAVASVTNQPDMRAGLHFGDSGQFNVLSGTSVRRKSFLRIFSLTSGHFSATLIARQMMMSSFLPPVYKMPISALGTVWYIVVRRGTKPAKERLFGEVQDTVRDSEKAHG